MSSDTDANTIELMLEQTLKMQKTCRAAVLAFVFRLDMLRLSLRTSLRRLHAVLLHRCRRLCRSTSFRVVPHSV